MLLTAVAIVDAQAAEAAVDTLAARASPVVAGIVDGVAAAHRQVQCAPIKYCLVLLTAAAIVNAQVSV
eukprot:SAG11_NODE_4303_length_1960_cov_1.712520_3_plen_67_part_01